MSGIKDYSTTPASNTALFPEGMLPSAVNDGMRQVQADVRSYANDAEWFNWGDTVSRNANAVFKIAADVTTRYLAHRRIKCFDTSTIYGTVVSSTYSAPDTTITIATDSGNLSSSLSSVALAILTPTSVSVPSTTGRKGADIASATTTDIGAATGDFVDITGTTTITGLGTIATGVERTVRFTGILTLTHNGTSLILPGATNITTAANDRAIFRSLGSGNWLCVSYVKASGAAVVVDAESFDFSGLSADGSPDGAADYVLSYDTSAVAPKKVLMDNLPSNTQDWVKISSSTASSSAQIDFTGLSSTYIAYIIIVSNVSPATDNVAFQLQTDSNGGASFDASSGDYHWAHYFSQLDATSTGSNNGSTTATAINIANGNGNSTNESGSWQIILHNPSATAFPFFTWAGVQINLTPNPFYINGGGRRASAAAIDAIRFKYSSGNIASGKFTLFGLKA